MRKIAAVLENKTNVAILTHNSADGDTLGSGLAFGLAIRKLGKEAVIVHEEDYPEHLSDLLEYRDMYLRLPPEHEFFGREWDAIAVFDTADAKLLGKRKNLLSQAKCVINVDHHVTNQGYGDFNLVADDASSAAEITYGLITELGAELDYGIALAIYTGICTDTGGFSYSNTTGACHEIAAKTLAFGIDVARLRYKFFDSITLAKLRCHALAANLLKLYGGGRIAIVVVSASALAEIGATEADCDGLVNIGRNITGVGISVFAREVRPGEFRVNFRSRGAYDVAAIANIFGGGGHKLAAGCTVSAAPTDVEALLLNAIGS